MPLYTTAYLKQLASNNTSTIQNRILTESRKIHTEFDIFLCHRFSDKDIIRGIYYELTKQGFSVYVDWIIDPQLDRNNVTKASAELVRTRLKASKSLLFAISDNVQMSRWMPWELGYVDGNTNLCAIFPVSENDMTQYTFKRAEYLLLYPYIKRAEIERYSPELYVTESANNYVSFRNWVRNHERPAYKYQNIDVL